MIFKISNLEKKYFLRSKNFEKKIFEKVDENLKISKFWFFLKIFKILKFSSIFSKICFDFFKSQKNIFLEIRNFENRFSSRKIIIFHPIFFRTRYECILSKNDIYHSGCCTTRGGPRVGWKSSVFHPVSPTFTLESSYQKHVLQ